MFKTYQDYVMATHNSINVRTNVVNQESPMDIRLADWLLRLDATPLECDGVTRCISTVLSKNGIAHEVHLGSVEVMGVGKMHPHFWIKIKKMVIDLRARMWLGDDERVPHGVFVPKHGVIYKSNFFQSAQAFNLSPLLFEFLSGQQLSSFT